MKKVLPVVFAVILFAGGLAHFLVPELYNPLIPDFLPALASNIFAGLCELVVGLLLVIPKYRSLGGLGFALLMIGFLPLHVWELFRDDPMIQPFAAALVGAVAQVVLIYLGWRIYLVNKKSNR
ncbi:MAG: hypothetical protein NXI10_05105 [bacterium]|nr:hypothetical protein [bacterium]